MTPEATAISNDITEYGITSQRGGTGSSLDPPENTVYKSCDAAPEVVRHVHPATALWQSIPMAAGQPSQIAPLTSTIDDVLEQIETIAETIESNLKSDSDESVQDDIRDWNRSRGSDQPFVVAARHVALNMLLKATLYEWYSHRGDVPILSGCPQEAFEVAAGLTDNQAFEVEESVLAAVLRRGPHDAVAELSWWRHGLLTSEEPADDLGYLFEELISAAERGKHGQFRTPRRISRIIRELAICDGDQVLDAGMGAGALSVPRDQPRSVSIFGIEQSRLGFLMAVTALALAGQPGVVHEADFFDGGASTLGMDADAAIQMGHDVGDVDIVPGQVDAAVGNPPYVANRNLERETDHYRQHLSAFGDNNQTPYVDGDTKLSGRSDLFVYFVTHATQFLTEGGRLVYLLPTKWMETRYGQTLQTFLFDHYRVSAVIEFDDSVFEDAQVNAVILVAERCADVTARRQTSTRFISINSGLSPTTINDLVTDGSETVVEAGESSDRNRAREPVYEITTVSQSVLEERDESDGPLTQYFREPEALRSLKNNEMLVRFDTLASVTYGKKTGNNEFFLLNDADLATWPLAERFYRPALNDFGSVTGYRLTVGDSDIAMLNVHAYVDSLDVGSVIEKPSTSRSQHVQHALGQDGYEILAAYIDHWKNTLEKDPGKDDEVWFDLGPLDVPELIHPYRIYKDVRVVENADNLIPTNCANGIDVEQGVDTEVLLGYFNSTVHAAFLELWGQSEGGGSLELTTGSLQQMPVADVRSFTKDDRDAVSEMYQALARGEQNAQARLDTAILAALDAKIDAATLREAQETLTSDRLPNG